MSLRRLYALETRKQSSRPVVRKRDYESSNFSVSIKVVFEELGQIAAPIMDEFTLARFLILPQLL
jgi:hypothetical protein